MTQLNGRCLCGKTQFSLQQEAKEFAVCHCSMCRRWSAGPLMIVQAEEKPQLKDGSPLGVYRSSEWGERCFCKECGSVLFWRTTDGSFYGVSVFALDDDADAYQMESQIFVDEQPGCYTLANQTPKLTGAEVFAMFEDGNV